MGRKKSVTDKPKAKPDVVAAPKWRYIGPPYPRVKLEGVPTFVPATITQERVSVLMERYPDKLGRFFALNERVKPGIEAQDENQQKEEE